MEITASTERVGVIGNPIAHSLSPLIHNTAIKVLGLDAIYLGLPVRRDELPAAVRGLPALGFRGANITLPHKIAVVSIVDRISDVAEAVGAVNTIVCMRSDDGKVELAGDNTDVLGFANPLADYREQLVGSSCLVLGSGGAARAVAYALGTLFRPARIIIAARSVDKATRMVDELGIPNVDVSVIPFSSSSLLRQLRGVKLVVNTTPIGQAPAISSSPIESWTFRKDQIVYDLIYNPQETQLVKNAVGDGATGIGGIEMLIAQAAESFRMWFDEQMPVGEVRAALNRWHLTG